MTTSRWLLTILDIPLALYAGVSSVLAWHMSFWLMEYVNRYGGVQYLVFEGDLAPLLTVAYLLLICAAHIMLPFTALPTAIGLRLGKPWADELGWAVSIFLIPQVPFGTPLGALMLYAIIRGRKDSDVDAEESSIPQARDSTAPG